MSVTDPGNQSGVSGTAITARSPAATDLVHGAMLTWAATGLPAGLVHRPGHRHHLGHTHHRRLLPGDPDGHRRPGLLGSATFTWTVTNTVTVTNPG